MKLIGITGKSGAGKTTFSNIMAKHEDVGVIHIDDLLREIKLKYFKFLMNTDNHGEKTKINGNLRMLLYKNKIIFNCFMKFRARLLKKRINNRIQELQNGGKKIIFIDDIFINFLHIFKDLDKIFIVKRNYAERKEALKERDNLNLKEILASDIAHYRGIYKDEKDNKKTEIIMNNGSIESLESQANDVFKNECLSKSGSFRKSFQNSDIGSNGVQDEKPDISNDRGDSENNLFNIEK